MTLVTINGRDARRVWAVAGLLSLAGVVGLVGVLLFLRGWDEAARVAGVISIVFAVTPLAVQLLGWSRRGSSSALTAEKVIQAHELLAMRVREQWRREAEARSLGDPEPMPVRWALTGRAVMDHPRLVLAGGAGFTGRSDDLGSLGVEFRRLARRRLVILGPAGAGKTTLAVQLLLELLDTPMPDEPVPVLLSLAGWDTTVAPRLQDWLADRLARDYPALRAVHPAAARALVEQGHVLPVLDGLDELPDSHRPMVITALNSSLGATAALVLTCRTEEYGAAVGASDVLTAAAVIEPEPLSRANAADYLLTCLPPEPGDSWRKVLTAVRDGDAAALAEVCATPLGLWLVRMVYLPGGVDPAPLLDHTDAATLRAELLDQLIPAAIQARPPTRDSDDPLRPRRSWHPDDVRRWLSLFAQQLDGQRDLLWWHLARHTLNPRLIGSFAGLVGGLAFGLMGVLAFGRAVGLGTGLAVGLAVGLIVKRQITDSEPKYANFKWRGRTALLVRQSAFGLALGLAFGLVVGLVVGRGVGLAVGLAGGLAVGLIEWIRTPSTADRAGTPRTTHRSDRAVILIQTSVFGLAGGLVGWLASGLVGVLAGWLTGGLAWMAFGLARLVVGTTDGRSWAWAYHRLAARWLAVTGQLPWRLMGFLDDAYRLGLLRIVGPAYQFRHAELQDHLTGTRKTGAR